MRCASSSCAEATEGGWRWRLTTSPALRPQRFQGQPATTARGNCNNNNSIWTTSAERDLMNGLAYDIPCVATRRFCVAKFYLNNHFVGTSTNKWLWNLVPFRWCHKLVLGYRPRLKVREVRRRSCLHGYPALPRQLFWIVLPRRMMWFCHGDRLLQLFSDFCHSWLVPSNQCSVFAGFCCYGILLKFSLETQLILTV